MQPHQSNEVFLQQFDAQIDEIFATCNENAPNIGTTADSFRSSVRKTVARFINVKSGGVPAESEVRSLIKGLHAEDLYLAIACAAGDERAWWEFDQQYRSYIENVSRYLAKTEADATDVADIVYTELYGTRVVDGARLSKFATYSGRGSLKGWLRSVLWHSLVDLHRASEDEVSLDEMTETVGDGGVHANLATPLPNAELDVAQQIEYGRYRKATVQALDKAFASLAEHEKLLLLYYHAERLTLREICDLLQIEDSPLRRWFQLPADIRNRSGAKRTHESTVMRWLNKSYGRIFSAFKTELEAVHGLSSDEIESCIELATQELTNTSIFQKLATGPS
jgi:RNA polymerase sigma-70 factor (ECF subfamily)